MGIHLHSAESTLGGVVARPGDGYEEPQFPAGVHASFPSWTGLPSVISACLVTSVMSNSFVTPWTVAPRLLCLRDFPGKNTGVGCHFRLQGIFPTQELNPCLLCLLHCR